MSFPQPVQCLLTHGKPSEQAIATLTEINPTSLEPSLHDILRAVSAVTGIALTDLTSPRRERRYVHARFVYFHLARILTSKSFPLIGYYCGRRDHTTVMHGAHQVELHLAKYAEKIAAVSMLITPRSVYGVTENHELSGV